MNKIWIVVICPVVESYETLIYFRLAVLRNRNKTFTKHATTKRISHHMKDKDENFARNVSF